VNPRIVFCAPLVAAVWSLTLLPVQTSAENPFGSREQPVLADKAANDLVITTVQPAKLPKTTFRFSRVGEPGQPKHEELLAVFAAFQAQYSVGQDGKITASPPWKDSGLTEITVTLQQEPQQGLYLLGANAEHCVFVKASESSTWTTGDKLHLYARKTGQQEWTNANGTAQKSPLYEQVLFPQPAAQSDAPTRAQLIVALRSGQSFDILIPQPGSTGACPSLVVQKLVW
jgi:hypothetical protein